MKKNPWSLVWIKNSNWWKERNSIGTLLLFSLVFTGMGSFFLLEFSLIPLCQVVRIRSWTVTPAVVTESFAEPYGRGGRLCIHYEYVWGDRKRQGNRYDFFHSRFDEGGSEREKLIESHPAGKRIECLVNPDNPAESVVSRSIPWTVWPTSLLPLLFICIGIAAGRTAVRNIRKKLKKHLNVGKK
ncbi:MAG: DUF3592 domain-containing protein [Lentisphaeria bacterium]|nr:DUF3592 domain-containing protein [Lentisphaeria bacterium]